MGAWESSRIPTMDRKVLSLFGCGKAHLVRGVCVRGVAFS